MNNPKQTGIGCMMLLAVLLLCTAISLFFMQDTPRQSLARVCASQGIECDIDRIMRDYPNEVSICQEAYGNARDNTVAQWSECLNTWGVPLD
jgi:hypothetical protein